jgi:4-hydroxybenzoate polyprenyltransferase
MHWLHLIRWKNLLLIVYLMGICGFYIQAYVSHSSTLLYFILTVSIVLTAAAGNIINDIMDIIADEINRPHRIIIPSIISKQVANITYGLSITLSLCCSFILFLHAHTYVIFIVSISQLMLFFYSRYFKRTVFLGNLMIAWLTVLPFVMVFLFQSVEKNININILSVGILFHYLVFSFLSTLLREVVKDIQDLPGDMHAQFKTLPVVMGTTVAKWIALLITGVIIFHSVYFLYITPTELFGTWKMLMYIIFVLLPTIVILYFIYRFNAYNEFEKISTWIKIWMFGGITSMLIWL